MKLKKLSEKDRIGMVRGYATVSLSDVSEGLNMQSDAINFLKVDWMLKKLCS